MTSPTPPADALLVEAVLPLRRPHRSGASEVRDHRVLLLRLTARGAEGWGECGPIPGYSRETLEECRAWLRSSLAAGGAAAGGGPPSARHALEAARADLAAAAAGRPLWRHLGGSRPRVAVGAVLGLGIALPGLPAAAEALAAEGYRRIKLKVAPGRSVDRVRAVRDALPHHDLAVDANGKFDPADPAEAAALDRFGLSFIEQPFAAGDLGAHARLAAAIDTPVCLDESIASPEDAVRALAAGAAGALNLKPARMGGLAAAAAAHDVAVAAGVPVWCGGMLESGVGKAAALALASLPGMTLPADLPPSSRHYADDLTAVPWLMVDGHLALPEVPGAGAAPDPAALERHTVSVESFSGT